MTDTSNLTQFEAMRVHKHEHMQDVSGEWSQLDRDRIADAFKEGWNQAHGIACHNVPQVGDEVPSDVDWVGYRYVDKDNVRDVHELYCCHAEEHMRCFSPWEHVANDLNSADEWLSEVLWEAYDAGTIAAIRHDISSYTNEDYGIAEFVQ